MRTIQGTIVSDKSNKTRVIEVTRLKQHKKYKKYYRVSRKFKAHDEKNEYKTGDKVVIKETRPISKDKRWIIIERVNENNANNS